MMGTALLFASIVGLGTVVSAAIPPPIAPTEAACTAITRRVDCSGFEGLTPTFKSVNDKFSVKYFLNLVLVDEEDRRYFKQQEITLWRNEIG